MRFGNELLHPKTTIQYGVHEQKCRELLKEFFRKKR
jgi:tRNA(adenine34) deaminase